MEAKLIVVSGKANMGEVKLRLPMKIGRGKTSHLIISHPSVSREHCHLLEVDGLLVVRDNHSSNGVYVDGKQVTEAVIRPGQMLSIGPLTFRADYVPEGDLRKVEEEDRRRHLADTATLESDELEKLRSEWEQSPQNPPLKKPNVAASGKKPTPAGAAPPAIGKSVEARLPAPAAPAPAPAAPHVRDTAEVDLDEFLREEFGAKPAASPPAKPSDVDAASPPTAPATSPSAPSESVAPPAPVEAPHKTEIEPDFDFLAGLDGAPVAAPSESKFAAPAESLKFEPAPESSAAPTFEPEAETPLDVATPFATFTPAAPSPSADVEPSAISPEATSDDPFAFLNPPEAVAPNLDSAAPAIDDTPGSDDPSAAPAAPESPTLDDFDFGSEHEDAAAPAAPIGPPPQWELPGVQPPAVSAAAAEPSFDKLFEEPHAAAPAEEARLPSFDAEPEVELEPKIDFGASPPDAPTSAPVAETAPPPVDAPSSEVMVPEFGGDAPSIDREAAELVSDSPALAAAEDDLVEPAATDPFDFLNDQPPSTAADAASFSEFAVDEIRTTDEVVEPAASPEAIEPADVAAGAAEIEAQGSDVPDSNVAATSNESPEAIDDAALLDFLSGGTGANAAEANRPTEPTTDWSQFDVGAEPAAESTTAPVSAGETDRASQESDDALFDFLSGPPDATVAAEPAPPEWPESTTEPAAATIEPAVERTEFTPFEPTIDFGGPASAAATDAIFEAPAPAPTESSEPEEKSPFDFSRNLFEGFEAPAAGPAEDVAPSAASSVSDFTAFALDRSPAESDAPGSEASPAPVAAESSTTEEPASPDAPSGPPFPAVSAGAALKKTVVSPATKKTSLFDKLRMLLAGGKSKKSAPAKRPAGAKPSKPSGVSKRAATSEDEDLLGRGPKLTSQSVRSFDDAPIPLFDDAPESASAKTETDAPAAEGWKPADAPIPLWDDVAVSTPDVTTPDVTTSEVAAPSDIAASPDIPTPSSDAVGPSVETPSADVLDFDSPSFDMPSVEESPAAEPDAEAFAWDVAAATTGPKAEPAPGPELEETLNFATPTSASSAEPFDFAAFDVGVVPDAKEAVEPVVEPKGDTDATAAASFDVAARDVPQSDEFALPEAAAEAAMQEAFDLTTEPGPAEPVVLESAAVAAAEPVETAFDFLSTEHEATESELKSDSPSIEESSLEPVVAADVASSNETSNDVPSETPAPASLREPEFTAPPRPRAVDVDLRFSPSMRTLGALRLRAPRIDVPHMEPEAPAGRPAPTRSSQPAARLTEGLFAREAESSPPAPPPEFDDSPATPTAAESPRWESFDVDPPATELTAPEAVDVAPVAAPGPDIDLNFAARDGSAESSEVSGPESVASPEVAPSADEPAHDPPVDAWAGVESDSAGMEADFEFERSLAADVRDDAVFSLDELQIDTGDAPGADEPLNLDAVSFSSEPSAEATAVPDAPAIVDDVPAADAAPVAAGPTWNVVPSPIVEGPPAIVDQQSSAAAPPAAKSPTQPAPGGGAKPTSGNAVDQELEDFLSDLGMK